MSAQLDFFADFRDPPILQRVDPDGEVIQNPKEVFRLPHSKLVYALCEIRLHPHIDGLWMWSTSIQSPADGFGSGYWVGAKWGKFARSRDDALHYAREEVRHLLTKREPRKKAAALILPWLETLQ